VSAGLRFLGASEKRMAILPDVPTYGESGYPGFVASTWTSFFLPAKTPDEIAKNLNVRSTRF
jgi:tripartite-type tricarboxylate transporter receptor subunit TctC